MLPQLETTKPLKTRYVLVWTASSDLLNIETPPDFRIIAAGNGFVILAYEVGIKDPLSQPKSAVKRVREFLYAKWKGVPFVVRSSKVPVTSETVVAMREEWLRQREYSGSFVTLNYPLTIPAWIRPTGKTSPSGDSDVSAKSSNAIPLRAEVRRLLTISQTAVQGLLQAAWTETELTNALTWEGPAWKASGYPPLGIPGGHSLGKILPSRVGRCITETAARIIRSQAERRRVFEVLREPLSACTTWEEVVGVIRAGREAGEDGESPLGDSGASHLGLYWNVAEQAWNYYNRKGKDGSPPGDSGASKPLAIWPSRYTEMQGVPRFERYYLTLAADDGGESGQVVQIQREGRDLKVKLRLPTKDHPEGIEDWTWRSFSLPLPERVVEILDAGGVLQAPDLRITKRGRVVLDLKVKAPPMGKRAERGAPLRIVSFDWGVKRILTAVIMERTAGGMIQISRPFFLHTAGLYEKLTVMREKIRHLDSEIRLLRTLLRKKPGVLDVLRQNRLATLQKQRERAWGRYAALQNEMAHLATHFLLLLAEQFGATVFAGEWLGSLRSQDLGRRLNWLINSQVRAAILRVLRYQARRRGLRVATVWPRGTSHRCPRCEQNGTGHLHRVPPRFEGKVRSSRRDAWFVCPRCGANGDRDYMAALNIGIEWDAEDQTRRRLKAKGEQVLKGKKLAENAALLRKGVPYRDALQRTTLPLWSHRYDLLVSGMPRKTRGRFAQSRDAGLPPATLAWVTPIASPLGSAA